MPWPLTTASKTWKIVFRPRARAIGAHNPSLGHRIYKIISRLFNWTTKSASLSLLQGIYSFPVSAIYLLRLCFDFLGLRSRVVPSDTRTLYTIKTSSLRSCEQTLRSYGELRQDLMHSAGIVPKTMPWMRSPPPTPRNLQRDVRLSPQPSHGPRNTERLPSIQDVGLNRQSTSVLY